MPETDNRIRELCEQMVREVPEFALGEARVRGITYPAFERAPATLAALFDFAAQHGGAEFLVYHDERMSYADAIDTGRRLGARLVAAGVGPGDPVAIAMRNYPEWIIAFIGIAYAGATAVPMNAWWQADEFDYALGDCGARFVFADTQRAGRLAGLVDKHGLTVVCVRGAGERAEPWAAFLAGDVADLALPQRGADDDAAIFYTSGSTGNPKGVVLSHRAIVNAVMNWALLTTADKAVRGVPEPAEGEQLGVLMTVPLFHVTGCNAMFLLSVLAGTRIVFMDRWDPDVALDLIERERITGFNGVPTMSWELLQAAERRGARPASLQSISGGGAARPASHVSRLAAGFPNVMPSVGYGLTETSGLGAANAGDNYQARPTSTGQPCWPLVEARIVDETGAPCAPGERGEIQLKSVANMRCYLNQPEATAAVLHDGFLATGDVGYLDEDGFLFIVDRLKDIVIRGGENIACQEVEAVLYEHPDVLEAAVFGVPDERLGEKPVAVVQVREGAGTNAEALREHVGASLAHFKVPAEIDIVHEQLPRTATGKIYKRGLRDAAIATAAG
jgi:acyl-CoA synthetase (AMP-forming)/AMP-acid ligase II